MSSKVLGFALKPHELRHSSASFYVNKFGHENVGGFYYRLGWRFGSKEALTYIKSKIYGGEATQTRVVNIVEGNRIEELEEEVAKFKEIARKGQETNLKVLEILSKINPTQDITKNIKLSKAILNSF